MLTPPEYAVRVPSCAFLHPRLPHSASVVVVRVFVIWPAVVIVNTVVVGRVVMVVVTGVVVKVVVVVVEVFGVVVCIWFKLYAVADVVCLFCCVCSSSSFVVVVVV